MPSLILTPAENEYLKNQEERCSVMRTEANRLLHRASINMEHCLALIAKSHGLEEGLPVEAECVKHDAGVRAFVWPEPKKPEPEPNGKPKKPPANKTPAKKKAKKKRQRKKR